MDVAACLERLERGGKITLIENCTGRGHFGKVQRLLDDRDTVRVHQAGAGGKAGRIGHPIRPQQWHRNKGPGGELPIAAFSAACIAITSCLRFKPPQPTEYKIPGMVITPRWWPEIRCQPRGQCYIPKQFQSIKPAVLRGDRIGDDDKWEAE